jgi:hypothetical protein
MILRHERAALYLQVPAIGDIEQREMAPHCQRRYSCQRNP